MALERILTETESDFTSRSVDYIRDHIVSFQRSSRGNFILGLTGTNGQVRRARAAEVFTALARCDGIAWDHVCIFLVDERYGWEHVEDSNAHLLRTSLVSALEKRSVTLREGQLIIPNTSISDWEQCRQDYEVRLLKLFADENVTGPHLVTLGLASDGSVASVFPEWYLVDDSRWALAAGKHLAVLCTETSLFEVPRRICVNLRVLREARTIVLYLGSGLESVWDEIKRDFEDAAINTEQTRRQSRTANSEVPPNREVFLPSRRRASSRGSGSAPPSPLRYIMTHNFVCAVQLRKDVENHYTFVVLGAAGDLAKKKTFPALFQLYMNRALPSNLVIIGCDDPVYHPDVACAQDLWQKRLEPYLQAEGKASDILDFRALLRFVPTQLGVPAAFSPVDELVSSHRQQLQDNRIFYLALPPFLFETAVKHIKEECSPAASGFLRVIVEKPFGRDLQSARKLSQQLAAYLTEPQIFRIDHYLAKTMVMNILTLRFANRELGRLFHADNVANVRITFKEDIGLQGRAGYFDGYGIIRDIMQNHLLQLLTLVTMEAPASLSPEDVRDEKVKVLKQLKSVAIHDCIVGQYEGYQNDPDIKKINERKGHPSKCATFAVCILYLDNERWSGVPLILKAGKGLETRSTRVRLQFKKAPSSPFGDQPQNELVMRVQPDEHIYYRILAKTPGLSAQPNEVRRTELDLDLKSLNVSRTPEAYEKLIHDVFKGQSHNFVRADELEAAWRVFDPLLKALEADDAPAPERYDFGTRGPPSADELINSMGYRRYTKTGVAGHAQDDFT